MNYAASLAVVVVLTFFFPLMLRIAGEYGVSRSVTASILVGILIFAIATYLIQFQVMRFRRLSARLETARAQVTADPENPRAYFVQGEHYATTLLRTGRRREASEVVDRYSQVAGAHSVEIVALREAIVQAERRSRRRT